MMTMMMMMIMMMMMMITKMMMMTIMTTHLNVRLHCSALHCKPATLLCTAITCLSHIVVILKVLIS